MTISEALTALFDEYYLEEHIEMVRDDVKSDPQGFEGLSQDHPKVRRFREVCTTLRAAQTALRKVAAGPA